MRKWVCLICLLLSWPVSARIFPANSHFGKVVENVPNQVTIAQTIYRTAPGLRVFAQSNALIFIRQLPVGTFVRYQVDLRGELFQIWMLTPQEIAEQQTDQGIIFPSSD